MTYDVCLRCIRTILPLMHPYTPFITEELWAYFKEQDQSDLIIAPWPKGDIQTYDDVGNDMEVIQELVTSIRAMRSRVNIPPSKSVKLIIKCNEHKRSLISQNDELLISLAKLDSYEYSDSKNKISESATSVVRGVELYIPLKGLVDLENEKNQLMKRKIKIEDLLKGIDRKLSNENFIKNAPEKIIKGEKEKELSLKDELTKINSNISMLS